MKARARTALAGALLALAWPLGWTGRPGVRETPPGGELAEARPAELLRRGLACEPGDAAAVSRRLPLATLSGLLTGGGARADLSGPWTLAAALLLLGLWAADALRGAAPAAALPVLAGLLARGDFSRHSRYALLAALAAGALVARARRPGPRREWALGGALAACALYRSPLAFAAPVLALRERGRAALPLILIPLALLLPWWWMNWSLHGEFVLFERGEALANLATGALGAVRTLEGEAERLAGAPGGLGATLAWAAARVAEAPGAYAAAVARRAALAASWGGVLLAAALVALWRRRRDEAAHGVALLAAVPAALHLLMPVESGYFEPVWAALGVLVAAALVEPGTREGKASGAAQTALVALAGAAALAGAYSAARYARLARPDACGPALDARLEALPADAWARHERGARRLRAGDLAGARADFDAAAAAAPGWPPAADAAAWVRARAEGRAAAAFLDGDSPLRRHAPLTRAALALTAEREREGRALLEDALARRAAWALPRGGDAADAAVAERLRARDAEVWSEAIWTDALSHLLGREDLLRLAGEAARLRPAESAPRLEAARLALELGRAEEARAHLARLPAGLSDEAARRAASHHARLGRPDLALALLAARARDSRDPDLLLEHARAAADAGRPEAARASLAAAEPLAPAARRAELARLWRRAGDPARALSLLEAAGAPALERAELALDAGDAARARALLASAPPPAEPRARARAAVLRARLGEADAAAREFDALAAGRGGDALLEDPELLMTWAELLAARGEGERALALLARRDPAALPPARRRAWALVLQKAGRPKEARGHLRALAAAAPGDAGLLHDLAVAEFLSGDAAAARRLVDRVLRLRPGWEPALRTRAALNPSRQ